MTCVHRSGTISELGSKAFALSRLASAGLAVPEWFAISPLAFERSLTQGQREVWLSADIERLRADIAELHPAAEVAEETRAGLAALPAGRYAVRSSAAEEDGANDSFAGQLASYLFVDPDAVVQRVADVWRSAFTPRIMEYRKQRGLSVSPAAPAVLVQCMIESTCSGVAFSADPVSGRRGLAIVSAVYGMGTALVGGEADADVYDVNRTRAIERKHIANKILQHSFCPLTEEGIAAQTVHENLRDQPVLTDEKVRAVAALARQAAVVFGRPQDIEWAMAGNKLYLIQSRPITTLRSSPDPDGVLNLWDNSNIIESYSGVTTPLTFSFARHVYEGVYRQFCRILRVPPKKIATNEHTFGCMLGLIRGRIYYNLLNWYRVLALLPGFRFNRRFMEQMMGVRESLPDDIVAELASASRKERIADLISLARMIFSLAWNLLHLQRRIVRFQARLNEALLEPHPALTDMRLDELASCYTQLETKLLQHWDAPLINDFFAMIFHGALRKMTFQWLGDETGTLANDAMRGSGAMLSAEPAVRVRGLAAMAGGDEAFVHCLCEGNIEEALRAVRSHPEFHAAYEAYLTKFGDRCMEELKLESETLHDNPLVLLRSVGEFARGAGSDNVRAETVERNPGIEQQVRTALRRSPLKSILLTWVLRQARERVRQRENLRLERTRLFGRIRRIFREAGRRLHANGVLDAADDIFSLQVEEILSYVDGTAVSADLAALASVRKTEFDQYKTLPAPPDRLETVGPVYEADLDRSKIAGRNENISGDERCGIGCCPGVVRGRARVVLDPRGVQVQAGSILVAEHTDPGWIVLFPSAKGLLVERGSLLSHSAIVARELGIPAVVSIRGLTTWLRDGDEVELDGARGTVRRIAVEESHAT